MGIVTMSISLVLVTKALIFQVSPAPSAGFLFKGFDLSYHSRDLYEIIWFPYYASLS